MHVADWLASAMGLVGVATGYVICFMIMRYRGEMIERDREGILREAELRAEGIVREAEVQARDHLLKAREEFDQRTTERRQVLESIEERLKTREDNLDKKIAMLDRKEQMVDHKLLRLEEQEAALKEQERTLAEVTARRREQTLRISQMTRDEARSLLLDELREELAQEEGLIIRKAQEEARREAETEARKVVTLAIERYAADQTGQVTASAVSLPTDDMKGRIIGRDGRNIKTFEAATGVNLVIDDTPSTVTVSSFDPVRREVARIALERLVADGRIHPSQIEEMVETVRAELDQTMLDAAQEAVNRTGLQGVDPELMPILGRLRFRHSYGQNILQHSVEMAHLMGMMAAELGLDPALAKRVGLFHDIGKAVDHEVEGGHALIGKRGEPERFFHQYMPPPHDNVRAGRPAASPDANCCEG